MRRKGNGSGGADLGHFFNCHGIGQDICASAAVFLGEIQAHHAQLGHLLDRFLGEALLFIDLCCNGLDFIFSKLTIHFAEQLMFSINDKIHN